MEDAVGGYLKLGLRIGRLVPGFVDAWFGDSRLAAEVDTEPSPDPADLCAQAETLLAGESLAPGRQRFLTAQLRALACTARRLIGEPITFAEELETYFDVRVELADPDRYAEVHDRIGQLLPGRGDLSHRLAAHRERDACPVSRLEEAIRTLSGALRERVRAEYGLPDGESVEYTVVTDKPWNAFNHYLGDFRSHVEINADSGHGLSALPLLVTHEAYPGHHTDHCVKEELLVRGQAQAEHTISLVNTPQCLIAEGAGEAALDAVLGEGWGRWAENVLREIRLDLDGERAELLLAQTTQLLSARQDAAILLHERGSDPEDAVAYLRRWMLVDEARARHMVRFLTDPLWRAYTSTYIEGSRLVRDWLAAAPDRAAAFGRLLRTPLLPAQLREETAESAPIEAPRSGQESRSAL
ncbi:DUF885 family protein [Amycolatopsis silviterrae]|uniref:DUF885 family protein n=1 Tax=Amycolatopsis silviterrae TaxID=1656914 RepID=A0ABW5HHL4_9PSEU